MKTSYSIPNHCWGEFHGELFSGDFSYEAGTHVARTAGEEELFEYLAGLGLAERAPSKTRPVPQPRKREV